MSNEFNFNFPDLDRSTLLSLDVETRDPDLLTMGPSDLRGGGYVVGYCVGFHDGESCVGEYVPIRHPEGFNYPDDKVIGWIKEQLEKEITVIGHNIGGYDLGWMATDGLYCKGKIIDTMGVEAIVDENAVSYYLNTLAKKYLGSSKTEEILYEYCANHYGGRANRSQGNNFWRVPSEIMREYGEGDAILPLQIWDYQKKLLDKEDLWEIFDLEMDLLPLLQKMRKRGVRVNMEKAHKLKLEMRVKQDRIQSELEEIVDFKVNTAQASSLVTLFEKLNLPIQETEKGNPCFNSEALKKIDHPVTEMISTIKKLEKFRGTFLEGYFDKYELNGRLHPQFHPLRKGDGGTVTGRFSSSQPNLQNIPARDGEYGPIMRSLFIPDKGQVWTGIDYSSIEVRVFMHYAKGNLADKARAEFHAKPDIDYHQMVADMTGLPRQQAKTVNFGILYGMGKKNLAIQLGVPVKEAEKVLAQYHKKLPYAKDLLWKVANVAEDRGYIKTILGRRRRFNLWEPNRWTPGAFPLPLGEAQEKYGTGIKRGFTYKALNALIQGSAADLMKKAMVDIYKSGVCDEIGVPLMTVHDELSFSHDPDKEEALQEMKNIMENAIPIRIPILADMQAEKSNWGEAH